MTVEEEVRVSDEQLISSACMGSVEAFDALYARYVHQAYRIAFSICLDQGRAQEAVQEGFLSAWQSSASFSTLRGSVAAWLLTIVRHRAIDITRTHSRHTRPMDQDRLSATTPSDEVSDAVLRREADQQLHACLTRLPAAQAEIITLAFFGRLSHTEIAHRLDLPAGTVKGRMRLGMDKLRVTVEHP
jgi:RNA polymerase sigma-70 factor (ECF subfamily)